METGILYQYDNLEKRAKGKESKKYIPEEYRFIQVNPPCTAKDWKYGFRVQVKHRAIHLRAFTELDRDIWLKAF